MKCQHCGHEADGGKFCTNCGATLETNQDNQPVDSDTSVTVQPEQMDAQAGATEIADVSSTTVHSTTETAAPEEAVTQPNTNDFTDKIAQVFGNFGHFFMTLLKQPGQAKKANHHDLYSAIITIAAFSFIIALSMFVPQVLLSRTTWFIPAPSFIDYFIMPLLLFLIIFGGIASLTYGATKIVKQEFSYADVIGKYGAYLLPYGLVYTAGVILAAAQLPVLPSVLFVIGIAGPIFVIPVLILWERKSDGIDRIYTLLGLYFVTLLAISFIIQSAAYALFNGIIGDFSTFIR
ncbi:zinc ribbon domain-containing protein [Ornithinibacillus contaminans]|uniref:zinc ribbon domain-containing protein n=1 Tax=Ornithinibacillus contaminans TaxID=694055 RepID=UPI00064E0D4E|nr:zinc ribbon domain-containing protein [Ornithinibacillus contaminans]